jgi:hypothetical protein
MLFSFNYESQWNAVEKLDKERLPKSALEKVELIYASAKSENNSVQFIRATLYKKNYLRILSENRPVAAINVIKTAIDDASKIEEKLILNSVLAEIYADYLDA